MSAAIFVIGHGRLEPIQLLLRAVDHGHGVVAASAEQFRDHGADFACAYDNDVFHVRLRVSAPIFIRTTFEW